MSSSGVAVKRFIHFIGCCALLAGIPAYAQVLQPPTEAAVENAARIKAVMARHTTIFSGQDAIDRRSVSERLMGKLDFVALQLRGKMSPGDFSAVQSLAAAEAQHLEKLRALQRSGNQRVCADRKGKNPIALVQEFDEVVDRVNRSNDEFYDQLLTNLSAEGRKLVVDYVSRPNPNATLLRVDNKAVAQEAPGIVAAHLEAYCTAPPAPPRPKDTDSDPNAPVGTLIR
jgi:hypothetical protein